MHPAEMMFRRAHSDKPHSLECQARGAKLEWRVVIPCSQLPIPIGNSAVTVMATSWCEQEWEAYDSAIYHFYYPEYKEYCDFDNIIGHIGRMEFDDLRVP